METFILECLPGRPVKYITVYSTNEIIMPVETETQRAAAVRCIGLLAAPQPESYDVYLGDPWRRDSRKGGSYPRCGRFQADGTYLGW